MLSFTDKKGVTPACKNPATTKFTFWEPSITNSNTVQIDSISISNIIIYYNI